MHLHTRNILWSLKRGIYVIRLSLSSWVRLWERFKHSLTKVLVQLSSGLPLWDEWQPAGHLTSPKNFTSAVRIWIGTVKSPSPVVGASVHWKILPTLLLIFRHYVLVFHIVFDFVSSFNRNTNTPEISLDDTKAIYIHLIFLPLLGMVVRVFPLTTYHRLSCQISPEHFHRAKRCEGCYEEMLIVSILPLWELLF